LSHPAKEHAAETGKRWRPADTLPDFNGRENFNPPGFAFRQDTRLYGNPEAYRVGTFPANRSQQHASRERYQRHERKTA
jgi:hypothetical protein